MNYENSVDHRFSKANIEPRYLDASLEKLTGPAMETHKAHIQNYIDSLEENLQNGRGLYLWSKGKGSGKTDLATIVLKAVLSVGALQDDEINYRHIPGTRLRRPSSIPRPQWKYTGYFSTMQKFNEDRKPWREDDPHKMGSYDMDGVRISEVERNYYKAQFLVMDDVGNFTIGTVNTAQTNNDKFCQLIDSRYSANLPTIITSNLSPDSFRKLYGDSSHSRICATMHVLEIHGPDYRVEVESKLLRL